MSRQLRGFVLSSIALLAACDVPVAPELRLQEAIWDGAIITAPVGEAFNLEGTIGGREIADAFLGSDIATIEEQSGLWIVTCIAVGESVLEITFPDDRGETETLVCEEAESFSIYYTFWTDLHVLFNAPTIGIQRRGDAQALQVRTVSDRLQIRCTELRTHRYLAVAIPPEQPKWYRVECVMGMPLPIPRPKVGIWVNLSAGFRAQGHVLQAIETWPTGVAAHGILNADLMLPGANGGAALTISAADAGDLALKCLQVGVAGVTVYFASGSVPERAAYSLTCDPAHDQGGGG